MAEQHTAHLSDINYLMERYKPDEIAAYIGQRNSIRQEIVGHDFSKEPSLQDAKNVVYNARKLYHELDPEVQVQFRNPLEFIKFIDNPANAEKMIKLGLIKRSQIENLPKEDATSATVRTTTKEEDDSRKRSESDKTKRQEGV